ncbi:MAG: zf-HC2 domain-containing protein [Armatimonadetes bacterium]|nr:zf-HC2 domain-containing protein [Armatimonadota bacterium]
MRGCHEIQDRLSGYVDGALPPGERAAVEAHLRECETCRATIADLEALKRLLVSTPPPPLPPGLSARIHSRLRVQRSASPGARRAPRRAWFVRRAASATAAAVLLAALLIGLPWSPPEQAQAVVPLDAYFQEHLRATRALPLADVSVLTLSSFQATLALENADSDASP